MDETPTTPKLPEAIVVRRAHGSSGTSTNFLYSTGDKYSLCRVDFLSSSGDKLSRFAIVKAEKAGELCQEWLDNIPNISQVSVKEIPNEKHQELLEEVWKLLT